MERILKLPSLGEKDSTDGATVTAISVAVGDTVRAGDCLLEIETDKVAIEVPAECDGTIQALTVKAGDQVAPGQEFGCILVDEVQPGRAAGTHSAAVTPAAADSKMAQATLGCESDAETKRQPGAAVVDRQALVATETASVGTVRANPSVRRLARKLRIDVADVPGTGSRRRITKEDVITFATHANGRTMTQISAGSRLPDFSEFGPTRREPLSKVARVTSEHMANCWSRVPHAWLQETIDITDVEEWRQQHKAEIRKSGGSLTITTILAKAVAFALREFPRLNSSYDETANEVVYKDYVDIGIAVDTEYGLLVPNCRAVDRKGLMELSRDLATLTAKAHSRKLSTQDLQGGGITISNLGGIGLNAVFPIVNWPQVVILGVSAGTTRPKWLDGRVVPRFELTATIGFDHRVVNGAEGARFLRHVKKYVEDIRLMLL